MSDGWCGYCSRCQEFKDDDYGKWGIRDDEVFTMRGCRQCGHTLVSMETIRNILPELLKGELNGQKRND